MADTKVHDDAFDAQIRLELHAMTLRFGDERRADIFKLQEFFNILSWSRRPLLRQFGFAVSIKATQFGFQPSGVSGFAPAQLDGRTLVFASQKKIGSADSPPPPGGPRSWVP